MMLQFFENMESGIAAKLLEGTQSPNPRKKYALEIARLGKRLYSGKHRVAWCGFSVPFDLLTAMNVTSCFVEWVGGMLASTGAAPPMLEESERAGYAADACGYHRAVIGAAMKGLMPEPDFLISSSSPCTGNLAVLENLARLFKKDLFVLDIPLDDSSKNVEYLAAQIKDMVKFVSRHTGQVLDEDKLGEAIENTNKAREAMIELYRLAAHVPSPVGSRDLRSFGIVMPLFLGTEAAVEITQAFRDEFAARIVARSSGVPGECFRLIWLQNRIQFAEPVTSLLEGEYKAAIVVEELNNIYWDPIDPEDPYTTMAMRAISLPFNGEINRRCKKIKQLAKVYRVDGAINPCHWGCREGTGARGLITKSLTEIGVPILNLEVDCVDSRNFSEGQLRTRLEAFMEMLDKRASPWK